MFRRLLLAPLAYIYLAVIKFRHWLFDHSLLRSERFGVPIICVGNITVGGTGKTPMSELLLESLTENHTVALISRGYGRRSKGYIEVMVDSPYQQVGDEPLQMKRKFPVAIVAVCERRATGIGEILEQHPEVEIIIMDDGFQHRYVTPTANIIMVDATRPIAGDMPLPAGSLRDTTDALKRANYFVVTKCPESISQAQIEEITQSLVSSPDQKILFTRIINLDPTPLYPSADELHGVEDVVAMAGIGNPAPFLATIRKRYNVVAEMIYNDHHDYSPSDISEMERSLAKNPSAVIITTEKDALKFLSTKEIPEPLKRKIYYTPIQMEFLSGSKDELLTNIEKYVDKN